MIPAFLFASCVKEESSQDVFGEQTVVKATVEDFGSDTKAAVSDAGAFTWQADDYITAFDVNYYYLESNKLTTGGSSDATFTFTKWNENYNTAIYPGDITFSEGKLLLPSGRTWKESNATPVMYATLENSTFKFKHVGGVVKVTVENVPAEARKFVFYTPGYAINGEFDLADDNGVKSINTSETKVEAQQSYALDFSETDITNPMVFYVPLPVGTYTKGFNFKLYDESYNTVGEGGGSKSQTVNRRALLKMPVVTLVGGSGEDVAVNTTIGEASNALETSSSISIAEISSTGNKLPVIELPIQTQGKEVNIAFKSIATSEAIVVEAEDSKAVADDVNISVPSNSSNANLTINLPTSTVTIAPLSDSESVIDKVTATTADNTLIIEGKITINTLEVVKGNVIIRGGAKIINWTRPSNPEHKGQIYVEEDAEYPKTELSGYEVITPEKIVAEADGVGYANLPEAIAKVTAGGTVTLKKDVTLTEILTINKNLTLSGESHTITSSAGRAINVSGAQKVTIQNLTINASGERAINIIQNTQTVIIENVTATAYNYTVNIASSAPGANVTISQSTLTGKNTVNVAGTGAMVNIKGGTVNCVDEDTKKGEDYAALCLNKDAVKGSIIANNNCTINVTEGSDSVKGRNGVDGGTVLINNSTDGVEIIVAAYDDENSDYYYDFTTISEAVNSANGETTIELIRDVTLTEPVTIAVDKNIVLDLNGKTVSTALQEEGKHYYAFDNKGKLTIKNTSGDGKIIARGNHNYGYLTLESGTIEACDGNGGYGIRNYSGSTFIMKGGSIATTYEDDNMVDKGGYDATPIRVDGGAQATISGGEVNNICDFTFALDNYGTTTISGGTFTSVHTTIGNYGQLTIEDGSFNCNGIENITAHVLWAASGTATINGGTFDGKDNYNGFNVDAEEGASVNINGGSFLYVHSGSLYGKGTIVVAGGEFFDEVPAERLANGYQAVQSGDKWIVNKIQ